MNISEKMSNGLQHKFFNRSEEPDSADKAWFESLSKSPYIFWSNNWSPYLDTIASSLYREALGDAGLGNATYPVILDYIRFTSEKKKAPKFEIDRSIDYINSKITSNVKTVDYYSEAIVLCKNIQILTSKDSGNSSLKVAISYVKTIIQARNIDKVRAVLDSRILTRCIPYLQTDDIHLRETLLDLLIEATSGFNRNHLYLFESYDINSKFDEVQDTQLRTADEIQKYFGLVNHLMLSSDDAMNKSNFTMCVQNYFSLNSKICEKYLAQIGQV